MESLKYIQYIKEKKNKLEKDLNALIELFSEETGCYIDEFNRDEMKLTDGTIIYGYLQVKIRPLEII